jgi:four helix bundle protein
MISHESLIAWQESEAVSLAVLDMSRHHWKPYAQAVFDQLQRASLSVLTNIAEGYAYSNSPTFRNHLRIAYGSAIECGDLLGLLHKANIVPNEKIQPILQRCRRCQRLILGLMSRYGAVALPRGKPGSPSEPTKDQ